MSKRKPTTSGPHERERRGLSKDDPRLGLVSLVGRPNVGKSSLFNRLVGGRPAIVEDQPGITRDRRYGVCEWDGAAFRVCDTGGLDPSAEGILGAMRTQTLRAVDEAAVLVFVVDAAEGMTPVDADVARVLRKAGKPVLVAANKVDGGGREALVGELYQLGFPRVFGVSAAHGRGVGDLLDAVVTELGDRALRGGPEGAEAAAVDPPGSATDPDDLVDGDPLPEEMNEDELRAEAEAVARAAAQANRGAIRVAFIGKPNAGKSSLINRLLGEDRVLVHHEPGTTRDPIDTPLSVDDREFVLVDTAGIRRRRVVKTLTEAVSAKMARDQVERADVVALIIDATIGATEEDARLANLVEEAGRGLLVVLNKGDLVPRASLDDVIAHVRETLGFVAWAPLLVTSAHTGRGVRDLMARAATIRDEWLRRVPTSALNKHFEKMILNRPPPSGPNGRHVRLFYITQAEVAPPTFFVSSNLPAAVGYPYRRYLINQLRKVYGFEGTPIKLALRGRKNKRADLSPKEA